MRPSSDGESLGTRSSKPVRHLNDNPILTRRTPSRSWSTRTNARPRTLTSPYHSWSSIGIQLPETVLKEVSRNGNVDRKVAAVLPTGISVKSAQTDRHKWPNGCLSRSVSPAEFSLRLVNQRFARKAIQQHIRSLFDDQQLTMRGLDEAFLHRMIDQPNERVVKTTDIQQSGWFTVQP